MDFALWNDGPSRICKKLLIEPTQNRAFRGRRSARRAATSSPKIEKHKPASLGSRNRIRETNRSGTRDFPRRSFRVSVGSSPNRTARHFAKIVHRSRSDSPIRKDPSSSFSPRITTHEARGPPREAARGGMEVPAPEGLEFAPAPFFCHGEAPRVRTVNGQTVSWCWACSFALTGLGRGRR